MTLRPIEEVVAEHIAWLHSNTDQIGWIKSRTNEEIADWLRTTLTARDAEVRREERERIMQLFSHTEYIKRNNLVDALHPSDPTT